MNLQRHIDRARSVGHEADVMYCESDNASIGRLAEQVGFLADVVADLCDDLTTSSSSKLQDSLQGEWRRGMWLQDASRWYLLVEQDDDEIWWAARFDSVGIASPHLWTLMPNSPDYQRCEAPEWWA